MCFLILESELELFKGFHPLKEIRAGLYLKETRVIPYKTYKHKKEEPEVDSPDKIIQYNLRDTVKQWSF